jgi:hypothetical protein
MKPGQVHLRSVELDEDILVHVEIATEPHEHAKGLMGRYSLGANEGMLFQMDGRLVYPFWMKNTRIPLDLIFIDTVIPGARSGHVVGVLTLQPFDEKRHSIGVPSTHVLEVNGGFARRWRISSGWKARVLGE